MTVLYHLTAPPPAMADTDAVFQEVGALQQRFGGSQIQLYPFRRPWHSIATHILRLAQAI